VPIQQPEYRFESSLRTFSEDSKLHKIGAIVFLVKFKQLFTDVEACTTRRIPERVEISGAEPPECMFAASKTLLRPSKRRLQTVDSQERTLSSWNCLQLSEDRFFWFSESTALISCTFLSTDEG
jgi:hypothetical protein